MKKDFDFSTIGKRMPYQVPEGFFERMEQETLKKVSEENRKTKLHRLRLGISVALAAAAMIGGIIFFTHTSLDTTPKSMNAEWIAQMSTETDAMDLYLQGLTDEELKEWVDFTENDIFYELTTENFNQDEN